MKPHPLLITLVAFTIAEVAHAAEASAVAAGPSSPDRAMAAARGGPRFVSIDFPGGTLKELIERLTKTDGVTFKFIVGDPADTDTVLPVLKVSNMRPTAVLDALRILLRSRGYQLDVSSSDGPDSFVCILQRFDAIIAGTRRTTGPQFESFQVAGALKARSIDQVIDAIRAAWEFTTPGANSSLKFKYHEPTGLLFIEGSDAAFKVARSVLVQLGGGFSIPTSVSVSGMEVAASNAAKAASITNAETQTRLAVVAEEIRRRRAVREGGATPAAPQSAPTAEKK